MENKLVRVPFDIETAKKILNGEIKGRVVTRRGDPARIIFFAARNKCSVIALVDYGDGEEIPESYTTRGYYTKDEDQEAECDLMLEVPEYFTFKDGDILSDGNGFVFILKKDGEYKTSLYAAIHKSGCLTFDGAAHEDDIHLFRFATEEEKQRLIEGLSSSEDYRAKDCLLRFFRGVFVPFQKILGRNVISHIWQCDFYSHKVYNKEIDTVLYAGTSGNFYRECVPYNDRTKHLRGTKLDYEEGTTDNLKQEDR